MTIAKTLFCALLAVISSLAMPVQAQLMTPVAPEHLRSALPGKGTMRQVTQLMWDNDQQRLVRARFALFDVLTLDQAQLVWRPDHFSTSAAGATGQGRITWMQAGAAPYETGAVIATLTGDFENGHLTGEGAYWHRSGASYKGDWKAGRFEGTGRLQWAHGDIYTGAFVAGKPQGEGKLLTRDGTLYRGQFHAGLREGSGFLYPATARAYRAHWRAGARISTPRLITGPAGTAHILEAQHQTYPDATLGISVNKAKPEKAFYNFEPLYDSFTQDGVIYVYPGAFADQWHGPAQAGLMKESEFGWLETGAFPEVSFNLDFQNNGVAPISIVGGRIEVAQSQSDLDPAIALDVKTLEGGQWWCQADAATNLVFTNYGWSDPIDAKINAGFLSTDGSRTVLALSGPITPSWPTSENNLGPAMVQAGVALPQLNAAELSCPSEDYEGCLNAIRHSPAYGPISDALFVKGRRVFAKLSGTLDYQWRDIAGTTRAKSQNFSTDMFMGMFNFQLECGEGSDYGKVYDGAIVLPTDQQNYAVPFPLNQTVPAGSLARWTFQIDSEKSTRHIFQVVLQLSDGRQIATRTVDLNYFTPRDPWRGTRY